ncbi:nitrogenase cofactor biosynthesis protein NifB [Herbivorax sp. ANBcel31]|uniref:nitrogenase cofactor biosynthesis protein NifB n=1 Tax=Herbivorax sp. ANBcel31 TaxID=3069754 RepID=UPI0027B15370|nr:nitrogenase cofactor biosynthesis protein NifB [Herbivorax sp. ANBcel31]MDQ2087104.1 nitrogenase cofactor biosynthesis protein NifB [Herbivorax sp. ANBcel31]
MKNKNFVNLNINPCKMCMPMGAVMALKGIENSMIILHGSQGCSTYIRRHMAGHYNEPIDVGSSSLSEEGTVYGGEANLKKGLINMIKLYSPSIIGVATTCLAETIGEDIKRITEEFKKDNMIVSKKAVEIVPISTPGYGGTQFEGFYGALTSIVKSLSDDKTKNESINIITGCLNPGDIRNIKSILDQFKVKYTILPDVSDTLDSPYKKEYKKIPQGGTKIEDIRKMAGAKATIEMGMTVTGNISPGEYLSDKYKVPLHRCPYPIGIRNTDVFLETISKITGKRTPKKLLEDRGRLLDGMIDSHKFNGEGRAVIFGDPEISYGVGRLCLENGIKPLLIATGSSNKSITELLKKEKHTPLVIDDTDFDTIRKHAVELKANLLIGNSDGKFITEREGIPLVRIGFPIHDRVGAQRSNIVGYNGSLMLLDNMTNTLLENKYNKYRKEMYGKYFSETVKKEETITAKEKTLSHPCFSGGACKVARMHIPVAPSCNIKCNYCNRKYDCMNESRPGVTSEVLSPKEALDKYLTLKEKMPNLKVLGIAGPGDALANFENTIKSLELIKEVDPEVIFCLSTNGLMLPYYADRIIEAGISHITVTINAVDPEIGKKIYSEVNFGGKKLVGKKAAEFLIGNQLSGLSYMASKGIVCKVNIVMIKGINERHIEEVVKEVKSRGVFISNIMPLIPAKGSSFENMPQTNNRELGEMRKKCEKYLKQMYHCKQCRADAVGILGKDVSSQFSKSACSSLKSNKEYTFAIATESGMIIDKHFGHVDEFYIYSSKKGEIKFIEKRSIEKYCTGVSDCDDEDSKIDRLIKTINDCDAVLALRVGYSPQKKMLEKGIKVIQTCGSIKDGVNYAIEVLEKKETCKTVI